MDSWLTWNSSPSYLPHTKNIPLKARHAGSSGQRSSLRARKVMSLVLRATILEGRIQFIESLNQQKIWNWEAPNSGVGSSTSHKGKWKCCETGRTVFRPYPILGDPGAVSPVGGKGATKVLKQKPLGTDPHLTISKRSSECWLLIWHKKCLYYCPQSANSIAWVCLSVFVLDCYCPAIQCCTCPVRSRLCVQEKLSFSTSLTRKRTTDESGKRSAEQFQFAPLSFFPAPPPFHVPFTFSSSPLFRIFPTIWEPGTG